MRPTRKFQPIGLVPLEERLVLTASAVAGTGAAVVLVPGAPQPGNSTSQGFPYSIKDTLLKGLPVYEQRTTVFNDHTTQTTDRLIVPDLANHTVTTTDWINLRGGAGIEKIVDVATNVGAVSIHKIQAKLPNGSTETELLAQTSFGRHWAVIAGINRQSGGGIQTITGKSLHVGNEQLTVKNVTSSKGTVQHVRNLTVFHDDTLEKNKVRITATGQVPKITLSTTTIVRLQPPNK